MPPGSARQARFRAIPDVIKNMPADDEYNKKARSHYGNTIDYIYPAPGDKMTINNDVEGLFPIIRPITDDLYNNRSGPWQWWDPESPFATAEVSPDNLPGVTHWFEVNYVETVTPLLVQN